MNYLRHLGDIDGIFFVITGYRNLYFLDDKCCQIALKIFPFLSYSRFNTQYPPPHFSPADHLSCRDSVMAPHFSKPGFLFHISKYVLPD